MLKEIPDILLQKGEKNVKALMAVDESCLKLEANQRAVRWRISNKTRQVNKSDDLLVFEHRLFWHSWLKQV